MYLEEWKEFRNNLAVIVLGRMMPPRDVHVVSLGPVNMLVTWQRGVEVADGVEVTDQLPLK